MTWKRLLVDRTKSYCHMMSTRCPSLNFNLARAACWASLACHPPTILRCGTAWVSRAGGYPREGSFGFQSNSREPADLSGIHVYMYVLVGIGNKHASIDRPRRLMG